MITFRAHYIKPVQILQNQQNDTFSPKKVSLVKLDPESSADVNLVNKLNSLWGYGRTYAYEMSENIDPYLHDCTYKRFYVITAQKDNFEKMNAIDVLGIAEVGEKRGNILNINFLQVDPEHNYFSPIRMFKDVGAALVKSIMELHPSKDITLDPADSAVEFYKKLGFKFIEKHDLMILKR